MMHLETAHKLGSHAAVNDFTAWLQNDDGNPTAYPRQRGSILKTAVVDTGGGMGERPQPTSPQLKIPSWAQDEPMGAAATRQRARPPARAAGSNAAASAFTPDPSQMSMAPKAAPAAMASKSDFFAGGSGMPADVMTGQSRMPAAPAAQMSMAPKPDVFTGQLPQKVSHIVRKTAAAIRKMANIMTPNPNVTAPSAQTQPAGNPAAKAIGNPAPGGGGAAPVTPPPAGSSGPKVAAAIQRVKTAIMGGKSQTCKDMPEVCNPGGSGTPLPPSPPPKPVTPPPKTAADHAVEQVMRKLGKSMSRRPLSRDGTKFEAIKKKLRKQKSKK